MPAKMKKTMLIDDFVRTIDDDEDVPLDDEDEVSEPEAPAPKAKPGAPEKVPGKSKSQLRKERRMGQKADAIAGKGPQAKVQPPAKLPIVKKAAPVPVPVELNPDFQFDVDASFQTSRYANAWDFTSAKAAIGKQRHAAYTSVDDKITRVKKEATEKAKAAKKVSERKEKEAEDDANGKEEAAEQGEESWTSDEDEGDSVSVASGSGSGSESGSENGDGVESDEDRPVVDEVNNDFGSDDEPAESEEEEETGSLRPLVNGRGKQADSDSEDEAQDILNDKKKAQFFEMPDMTPQEPGLAGDGPGFTEMNLSRPIMRSIASLGYTAPTQIQSHAIPIAMLGKDICGSAVTGSGKTAAFIIPILERLLFRPKNPPVTRVLVLVPTRELGIQCHSVASNLAKFTDIKCALCVGGLSTKAQEIELRKRPDVVIATPGRLIDHVRNSMDFTLDSIEILVIDEADRILEDGFKDELAEIISFTSKNRQTMLFSATMTDSVDDLVKLSLNRPVRLFVNNNRNLASGLVQEFIRIRNGKNDADRTAILASLVMRTYKTETIIFFGSKVAAHNMKIVFGLLGLKAAELHGDLSQLQRLEALEQFRDHKVDFLLATDLASRGLDIAGVKTVINYDMPKSYQQYVHRVGRTARAEANGRSVSLVTEADRKILKQALKNTHEAVKNRIVPPAILLKYRNKIDGFRSQIKEILEEEVEEKALARADMEATKAENMINYAGEIAARPARTWFQSEQKKKLAKAAAKEAEAGGKDGAAGQKRKADTRDAPKREKTDGLTRKKKRRLEALREMKEEGLEKASSTAARHAKAQTRPTKLSAFADPSAKKRPPPNLGKNKKKREAARGESKSQDSSPKKAAGKKPFVKGGIKKFKSKSKHKRR